MKCRNKLPSTTLNNNSINDNSIGDNNNIGSRMHLFNRLNIIIILFLIVLFLVYSLFNNIYYIGDNNSSYQSKHKHIRGFGEINLDQIRNTKVVTESRLYDYCNRFIPDNYVNTSIHDSEWKLVYFAATIRHGDRSAIHQFPGSLGATATKEQDLKRPSLLDTRVTEYLKYLPAFTITKLHKKEELDDSRSEQSLTRAKLKGEALTDVLNPNKLFGTPDLTLTPGQLTSVGFMQHIALGELLHSYYTSLLNRIHSSDQIYVRSTNYARTIQSVAALIITMLPQLVEQSLRVPNLQIPILSYEFEEDEIMHGIGTRFSSHNIDKKQTSRYLLEYRALINNTSRVLSDVTEVGLEKEAVLEGSCRGANILAKVQRESFQGNHHIMDNLLQRFGVGVLSKTAPELMDAVLPRLCHDQQLPCPAAAHDPQSKITRLRSRTDSRYRSLKRNSTGQCLAITDLQRLMNDADRFYCGRFGGDKGGLKSTELSLLPFMQELVSHLVRASLSSDRNQERVALFSGHDTVIAPVLASLGVYRGDLCRWPPYASRIIFELWQPVANLNNNKSDDPTLTNMISEERKNDISLESLAALSERIVGLYLLHAVNTSALSTPNRNELVSYSNSFVRVIFNGRDITQLIPQCADERSKVSEINFSDESISSSDNEHTNDTAEMLSHLEQTRSNLIARLMKSGSSLCSVEALAKQVKGMLGEYDNLESACEQTTILL